MEIVLPRIVLAEFNTHRVFSRNSASSRAIPVEKMIRMVKENPYIPSHWGKNQKGMQAELEVNYADQLRAQTRWMLARDAAIEHTQAMLDIGIHKQITNRLLEPFMWHTIICSATEWQNFFHLRNNEHAHPDIHIVAKLMQEEYEKSHPKLVRTGEWHLPYVFQEDIDEVDSEFQFDSSTASLAKLIKICCGRCARVSYLTHDGKRELHKDVELHDDLLGNGHMSPLEHPATPCGSANYKSGNFVGWSQYRKLILGEEDILGFRKAS